MGSPNPPVPPHGPSDPYRSPGPGPAPGQGAPGGPGSPGAPGGPGVPPGPNPPSGPQRPGPPPGAQHQGPGGPGGQGPGGQGPGGPQNPWQPQQAAPAPKKRPVGLIITLAVVTVLALIGGGTTAFFYMENEKTSEELASAQGQVEDLGGQIDESEKEAEARAEEAQEAYENADLPGLYDEVTTLSDDLESSMQDFVESSTGDGASAEEIETLFQNMYDCMGAREEYNMGAAEHSTLLEENNPDLPAYLSEDQYDCGRDFWGV